MENFFHSMLALMAQPDNLLVVFCATILGIVIGALPGLSTTMGVAMLVGIASAMPVEYTLGILVGVFVGGVYGGSISAILLNIPGTPAAAATAMDGYVFCRKGEAPFAIKVTRLASVIGTLFGVVVLATFTPLLGEVALLFTSGDFFALGLMGVAMCGSLSSDDSSVKGWISALLGMFVAMMGLDDIEGVQRFTLGLPDLFSGVSLIPVMMGLYAIPEVVLHYCRPHTQVAEAVRTNFDTAGRVLKTVLKKIRLIFQSACIGIGLGILPGVGEDVSAWVAYDMAKKTSTTPEKFGKGSVEGIIAPEVANNAGVGGALVPMLVLGIPGSPPAAILLGALMLHGIQPGPMLGVEHPEFLAHMVAILFLAMVFLFIGAYLILRPMLYILKIPLAYLMPIIACLAVIGAYAINLSGFDFIVLFVAGIAGFLMRLMKYSPAPMVLGMILGKMIDVKFRSTLIYNDGQLSSFFTNPVSCVALVIILLLFARTFLHGFKHNAKGKRP